MEHILHLLDLIAEAMSSKMCVLVLADRGLWSQRLRRRIRKLGFHPVQRLQNTITFQPENLKRQPAQGLVKGPGQAWVGKGTAFKDQQKRCKGTLIVVWVEDEQEPWVLLSDLAPRKVGV